MKKTSKKVVSLLTILSFLLTLVPAAAFADGPAADPAKVTEITAPAANANLTAGKTTVEGKLSQEPDAATEKVFVGVVKDKKIAKPVEAKVTAAAFKGDVDVAKGDTAIGAVVAKDETAAKDVEVTAPVAITVKDAAPAVVDENAPTKDRSYIEVEDDTRDVGDKTQVRVGLKNSKGKDAKVKTGDQIVVWAGTSTSSNDTIDFLNFKTPKGDQVNTTQFYGGEGKDVALQGVWAIDNPKEGVNEMDVQFNKEGDFQFYAAIVPENAKIENISDLAQYRVNEYGDAKVKVRPDEKVKAIEVLQKIDGEFKVIATFKDGEKITNDAEVLVNANGLTETEIKVRAYKDTKLKDLADKGTVVDFDTNSSNLRLDKDSEKIDYTGEASVKLTGDVYGTYKLYITAGDIDVTMTNVVVQNSEAAYIELSKTPKGALAWNSDFKSKGMEDFVRIQIKDINNNVMNGPIDGEPILWDKKDPEEYVKILDQPDSMNLDDDQFYVKPVKVKGTNNDKVEYKDYYTLVSKKELKEGKYSVQLGLKNGKKVVVNFEIAKFGTAKDLKIDYDTESVELNSFVEAPTIVLVDENGVEKKSEKRVTLGYNGYAVETANDGDRTPFNTDDGSFWVKDDEKYLGSKITVTAVAEREGLSAKAELTVAQDGRNIKFLDNKGAVGANNKVIFQLVDGDGKTVALGGGGYDTSAVTIQSVSDDTAKVSATVNNTGDLSDKGTGELSLTSDKPVTADIQVYVRNKEGKYYAGNLKYTFGKTASNADTTVVMTIGSKDVIVDNNIVATDTAALIKNDRTFVPYRALAEAFGAKVEWNEKDRTVTTEMDGKRVVMTIDKKEYKVNDKDMTMDVAPYISGDRTLVPVRFVAEALGFKVTPTYNTDGTTASVVFNK
ncbi:MAG: copper amine oxidase N-terminal domain-containing protein [Peptococcus niger]|nr:copper amine oxidase N-terminal domain-containing protein [Peptococcus niger]